MKRGTVTKAILTLLAVGMITGAVYPYAAEKHETIWLIKTLRSENLGMRVSTAQILAQNGEKKALKPLIRMLKKDVSDFARFSAALALAQLGDINALDALKFSGRYDRNENVRSMAEDAIFEIKRSEVILALN
ncbi:MAG: HEAT repeat domain-containing protein [Candidatus Marinimicrobia bacterium]|nr:HEAT repeat domain-containing protein [Candidatus Neomarinimicrobiota bacterium]